MSMMEEMYKRGSKNVECGCEEKCDGDEMNIMMLVVMLMMEDVCVCVWKMSYYENSCVSWKEKKMYIRKRKLVYKKKQKNRDV